MKKTRIHLIALFALTLLGTSCNQWLDVKPATQIDEEEQFSSEQGFIDALVGTYQKMTSDSTYGTNLGFGFVDVLAQLYQNKTIQTTDWYGQTARYNYNAEPTTQQNPKASIAAIWAAQYGTIAQANYILKNITEHGSLLSARNLAIIKGEALAIRAFLHFDLLRLFAPAYLEGANAEVPAIPYMTDYTVNPQRRQTEDEVIGLIEKDLLEAENLLQDYPDIDQIAGNQESTSLDLFLMYRQNHLNYWAVKGLLARLYLYKGDKVNALKYAQQVIGSDQFSFVNTSTLSTDEKETSSDITFSSEHVFSLYVSSLKNIADNYFKSGSANSGEDADLFTTRPILDATYEASLSGYGIDIRGTTATASRWNQVSASVVYTKKYYSDASSNVKQRLIPVIRLPEIYYIAAESAATVAQGLEYLNEVRQSRLIPELTGQEVGTAEQLNAEIGKEYQKELYGEGQLWYYYKRNNTTSIPNGIGNPMTESKYTLPLPNDEIEFGLN